MSVPNAVDQLMSCFLTFYCRDRSLIQSLNSKFFVLLQQLIFNGYFITVNNKITILRIKTHSHVSCSQVCVSVHEPTFSSFQPFIAQNYWADFNQNQILDALKSCYLIRISNLKGISSAVPEIHGSKSCPNFFVFFFFATLINQPSPTSNSTKFALSMMLYNAQFTLKFGWILINFE